jgi:hypothetical protein
VSIIYTDTFFDRLIRVLTFLTLGFSLGHIIGYSRGRAFVEPSVETGVCEELDYCPLE